MHYRAPLNFSDASLAAAGAALERLDTLVTTLESYREDRADDPTLVEALDVARAAFGDALDDDLNISEALAALFDLVRDLNRRIEARSLSTANARQALTLLRDLDVVLGVLDDEDQGLPSDLVALLEQREPLARRATGPPRTGFATSSRRVAWPWRTPATDSAGGGSPRPRVADRPPDDRRRGSGPKRDRPRPDGQRPGPGRPWRAWPRIRSALPRAEAGWRALRPTARRGSTGW